MGSRFLWVNEGLGHTEGMRVRRQKSEGRAASALCGLSGERKRAVGRERREKSPAPDRSVRKAESDYPRYKQSEGGHGLEGLRAYPLNQNKLGNSWRSQGGEKVI